MPQPFDLEAYLARIDYTGSRMPTYDTLLGVLRAHLAGSNRRFIRYRYAAMQVCSFVGWDALWRPTIPPA